MIQVELNWQFRLQNTGRRLSAREGRVETAPLAGSPGSRSQLQILLFSGCMVDVEKCRSRSRGQTDCKMDGAESP